MLGILDAPVQAWLNLPIAASTTLLVVFGLVAGAIANFVITTLCWEPRPISPWVKIADWPLDEDQQKVAASLPPRRFLDRVPVLGWLRLSRESELFGRGFWIRPLLIELSLVFAFLWMHEAWLTGYLFPESTAAGTIAACRPWMALVFFFHAILLTLMTAATFIDFDERTIPDVITIPGTIFGIVLASITPYVFIPGELPAAVAPVTFQHPLALSPWWMTGGGLAIGLLIWTTWCFALADRRVILRHGWTKAFEYFMARLTRHSSWKVLAAIWATGVIGVIAVHQIGGTHWLGMLSSLIGLAVGGGIIWAVRLVGSWAMQMEAMGFGDVTLMAMVGSFIGWQGSIIAFFLAPLAAIVIVLVRYIITRDHQTPFGPYLCAGTALTVLWWDRVYNQSFRITIAIMGSTLFWFSAMMLVLLGVMLWAMRWFKQRFLYN
ncbi:Type IV leader peptidase family protein [Neorhodopirellula lusitana]|uniref:Type IV leader peptidase family protein n=1 Tax=Neorhodopirellula lusitana TaxID=445327 RepID=A0ABY1PT58_9BACT|nr:A24 family peptidase [Neorhodopirellula lusitana]SMP46156.1 Type IV leader peptidase family protein [Neorhodopirellula lusitana]